MKKKNLAALFMAGAMCFGLLAGCSNSSGQTSDTPNTGNGESQPVSDGNQVGSDVVTIKVGGIGPITGDLAQYGTATQWGAQIAVDEINALNGPSSWSLTSRTAPAPPTPPSPPTIS